MSYEAQQSIEIIEYRQWMNNMFTRRLITMLQKQRSELLEAAEGYQASRDPNVIQHHEALTGAALAQSFRIRGILAEIENESKMLDPEKR